MNEIFSIRKVVEQQSCYFEMLLFSTICFIQGETLFENFKNERDEV